MIKRRGDGTCGMGEHAGEIGSVGHKQVAALTKLMAYRIQLKCTIILRDVKKTVFCGSYFIYFWHCG
jgi:hypothetical protein